MPKVSNRRSKILSLLTLTSLGAISTLACDLDPVGTQPWECGLFGGASVTSAGVSPAAVALPLGGSDTLTVTVRYDDCPNFRFAQAFWFVRDTAVVKLGLCVGSDCEVREIVAVGVGETVVSASVQGFGDSTQVTVTSN